MSFIEKKKRRWGDRSDGVWVRDANGLNVIMASLFPKRTDCEAYLHETYDITDLVKFIDSKNTEDAPYKTTLFHCFVTMFARICNERPYLNRFLQGGRVYERDEITLSFVAKKRFVDHSEESLMQYVAKGEDTLADVSRHIVGEVHELRNKGEEAGVNDIINTITRWPRFIEMSIIRIIRWLDFWGKVPKALSKGDSNFATVMLSNLGSIKCPAVYHHLNNYGTTSIFITIGTMRKEKVKKEDGTEEERTFVDIGATVDERIADGFYFARSLKLIHHICAHPELLDRPLQEDSEYEYN